MSAVAGIRSAALRVRICDPRGIDARTLAAWADLEKRALDPNPYLSPLFVMPAVRHLSQPRPILFVLIETASGASADLVGVGVFEPRSPTRRFPLRHLRAYRSAHSYLSGLLLDESLSSQAACAFFEYFWHERSHGHALEFVDLPSGEALEGCLQQAAAEHGTTWVEYERQERAILRPRQGGDSYLQRQLPGPRRSDLRRNLRRLGEHAEVHWRTVIGDALSAEHIERFLDLEHRGWKARNGTSLRASPADEAFFREMITGFSQAGRAFFTELCLAGQPIAVTANLLSGHAAFGFKLGWDPEYAKMAPGILNAVELVRHAPDVLRQIDYMDSGASQGSFIEELWSERRWLASGAFATTALGRCASACTRGASRLRRALLGGTRRWIRARGAPPAFPVE